MSFDEGYICRYQTSLNFSQGLDSRITVAEVPAGEMVIDNLLRATGNREKG